MKYHTLIFDLDGTLTDPFLGVYRCMNHALSSHGYEPVNEQQIKHHIGPPLENTLQVFTGSGDEAEIRQLVATYRERYGEIGYAENSVYDGIRDMLEAIKGWEYSLGVCTSKFQKYAIKVLKEFDLFDYFDFVSGPTEIGVNKSTQLAQLLSEGTVSTSSLMIGDRAIDLRSARNNQLYGGAVLWGYGSEEELKNEQPAHMFATPTDLVATLAE